MNKLIEILSSIILIVCTLSGTIIIVFGAYEVVDEIIDEIRWRKERRKDE